MRAKDLRGRRGEEIAADHLIGLGLVVLDRNWRCDIGELDIVAREGDSLVICEVKTRSSRRFGDPLEAITAAKATRLRRLAGRWASDHGVRAAEIRIDLVGIVLTGNAPVIEHIRGALA